MRNVSIDMATLVTPVTFCLACCGVTLLWAQFTSSVGREHHGPIRCGHRKTPRWTLRNVETGAVAPAGRPSATGYYRFTFPTRRPAF